MVNELLCFVFNKHGKATRNQLKHVVTSVYSKDEICVAKDVLFEDVSGLKVDGQPRYVKRQKSDNRGRLLCDDILDLLMFIDERKLIDNLSMYAAVNLEKIPDLKPEELELVCMSRKLDELDKRMTSAEASSSSVIMCKLDDVCAQLAQLSVQRPVEQREGPTTTVVPLTSDADVTQVTAAVSVADDALSWADTAATAGEDRGQDWQTVKRRKSTQSNSAQRSSTAAPTKKLHRVCGKKELANVNIRTVPRTDILAAFVGRLHKDTSEQQLTDFLTAEGMKGIVCKKLQAKDGKKFSTAAFYVTCCAESVDVFYDEHHWPDGVEVRDWVYKN